MTFIIFVKIN